MGDLQSRLLEAVERTGVPGASAALIVRGELTTAQAGVATVGGEAMAPDHQFPIMSLTKAMTAVLAFQLVDEGRLSLDDPIRSLLPNFSLQDGHTADAVTVRHLLGNTSGLPPFHFVDVGDDDGALGDSSRRSLPIPQRSLRANASRTATRASTSLARR